MIYWLYSVDKNNYLLYWKLAVLQCVLYAWLGFFSVWTVLINVVRYEQ